MGQVFTTLSSVTVTDSEDIPLEELGLADWEDLAAVEVSESQDDHDEQIGDNFIVVCGILHCISSYLLRSPDGRPVLQSDADRA